MKESKKLERSEQIREANTKKRWCLLFLDKGQNDKVNNRKRIAQRFADLWYNDERKYDHHKRRLLPRMVYQKRA